MSAEWLSKSNDFSVRFAATVEPFVHSVSQPANLRRIRLLLVAVFALWAVLALARAIWAFIPREEAATGVPPTVINPVSSRGSTTSVREVDIEKMKSWHLFGEAGAATEVKVPEPQVAASSREGIEDGARDTRLSLKLRGIVASTEDGMGHAIIEHQSKQAVYAVEDKLPVSGNVTLAKVMPRQVILNNGGTYERLQLFEKSDIGASVTTAPARRARTPQPSSTKQVSTPGATAVASNFRKQLYEDPQSLAQVVNVSAVRENGALQGYRVAPGKARDEFEQLGFKPGDLVTSVNGVSLDNPANTMKLYNMLRTANEVVFEVQREGQPLTLNVNLGDATQ